MLEFATSLLGLIAAIVGTIGAALSFFVAWRQRKHDKEIAHDADAVSEPSHPRRAGFLVFLGGLFTGVTLLILGVRATAPDVDVRIVDPPSGGRVSVTIEPNGSGQFHIRGTSSGVVGNRRIYVFVHPEKKFAPGWWIQNEPAVLPNGEWTAACWIGTQGAEAVPGDEIWIAAMVAKRRMPLPVGPDGQAWVPQPQDLDPIGKIEISRVTVGAVRRSGT